MDVSSIAALLINVGMWFERFVIVVSSLSADYLPSSWDYYSPTFVDIGLFVGSFGLFFTFFLIFLRFVPMIAISEVKAVLPQADPHFYDGNGHGKANKANKVSIKNGGRS
jgi:molybdopterin-containing oxidoreductase family membrane subunit